MKIDLSPFSGRCACGHTHNLLVKGIFIEPEAGRHLADLLAPYRTPVFVCDSRTKRAFGKALNGYFEKYTVIELPGEDIHADNTYAAYLSEKLDGAADILIAVGSGTVHDLVRLTAFEKGIPFISMPTAASVDGFVSTVAAMTWNGMKKTFPAQAPLYVLADTKVFSKAPYRLTASGISDLLGKYTALADWKISNIITGEYFCPRVYEIEMKAVAEVEEILDKIKSGDENCIEKLMYALILSGLAMQMIGNSRPASGAEHHLSHLWEMGVINEPIDALHGEKVSVGLILCLEKYERILAAIEAGKCRVVDNADFEADLLRDTFGSRGLYEAVLQENGENLLKSINLAQLRARLPDIAAELRKLPDSRRLSEELKNAGCVTTVQELKLPDIRDLSLQISPYVRRRLTLMRMAKLFDIVQ